MTDEGDDAISELFELSESFDIRRPVSLQGALADRQEMPDDFTGVLKHIRVERVLGKYTHELALHDGPEPMIVFGPNGVGKTRFLEIINAACHLRISDLEGLPFDDAYLSFEGGYRLTVRRRLRDNKARSPRVDITVAKDGESLLEWSASRRRDNSSSLESWIQIAPSLWEDERDGETISTAEFRSRYGPAALRRLEGHSDLPPVMASFARRARTHLIETQRLQLEYRRIANPRGRFDRRDAESANRPTIERHAGDMRRRLDNALAENSRTGQQLDRTFPRRVLERAPQSDLSQAGIRARYAEQNRARERLADVALVTLNNELALPERDLTVFELNMLDQYLDDAAQKLAPLESLLDKIDLLEGIVNARLLDKELHVVADRGLIVRRSGEEEDLDLLSLSSGEQHEIILMYELLFNVPPGSFVMIDEPEISLHVAWQAGFLTDVSAIAANAGFRYLVATHSPQIIDVHWPFARRLGPEEAPF